MIESVGFKNFLALKDVKIDLERLTVIVGPNACGKSTILEGIYRIAGITSRDTIFPISMERNFFGHIAGKKAKGIDGLSQTDIDLGEQKVLEQKNREMETRLSRLKSKFRPGDLVFSVSFNKKQVSISFPMDGFIEKSKTTGNIILFDYQLTIDGVSSLLGFSQDKRLFLGLPNPTYLRPLLHKMQAPSYTPSEKPNLEQDGAGLSTVCAYLQLEKPEIFALLQEKMRSIIPNLRRFRVKFAKVGREGWFNLQPSDQPQETVTGHHLLFDFENAEGVTADRVSEGTLLSLCILVATNSQDRKSIVLIDDIERGLHPKATFDLLSALRGVLAENPGLQIVATTHSPYVLDHLQFNEVRVATLVPERGTLVARLDQHPDFEKWREVMSPGEFWSHVGETWVAELPAKTGDGA
jgi:AAA15 family ATPase/GTPase